MKKKKLEFQENKSGCFIVTSHRLNKEGYCYLWHVGQGYRAHRLIYQECFGEIPEGLVVRHKCDTPSCINPEHLELGTLTENNRDCVSRERNARGAKNGKSAINDEIAREIKLMLSDGVRPFEIVKTLNVTRRVVRGIKELNLWKHVKI